MIGASLLAVVALIGLGGSWWASRANDDALPSVTDTPATIVLATSQSDSTTTVTTTTQPRASLDEMMASAFSGSEFNQFVSLLKETATDTLGGGPYTVFAPTNDAFDKLPVDVLRTLQDNPDVLKWVLLHHVIDGTIKPEDMKKGKLTTLAGDAVQVTQVGDQFFVDGNKVGAGVDATNGYVYVMSDVLVPAFGNVVDVSVTFKDAGFGTWVDAITAAELVDTLSGEGPFTVFAPVDAAFEALDPATLNAALADPKGLLTTVLTYHLVPGKVTTDQFTDGGKLTTIQGEDLITTQDANGNWVINGNPIAVQNIQASNGVIHAMGVLLLPPTLG